MEMLINIQELHHNNLERNGLQGLVKDRFFGNCGPGSWSFGSSKRVPGCSIWECVSYLFLDSCLDHLGDFYVVPYLVCTAGRRLVVWIE
jgi:hypothetical protein